MPSRRVSADGSLAEQLLDLGGVRGGNDLVAREAAREAARLALEQVATARLLAHDLAGPGDPEPLLGAGVRLVLRHWRALLHLARSQVRPGWLVGSKPLVRTGCPRTSGRPSSRARACCRPARPGGGAAGVGRGVEAPGQGWVPSDFGAAFFAGAGLGATFVAFFAGAGLGAAFAGASAAFVAGAAFAGASAAFFAG